MKADIWAVFAELTLPALLHFSVHDAFLFLPELPSLPSQGAMPAGSPLRHPSTPTTKLLTSEAAIETPDFETCPRPAVIRPHYLFPFKSSAGLLGRVGSALGGYPPASIIDTQQP